MLLDVLQDMATVLEWGSCSVRDQSASSACASDGANGKSRPTQLSMPTCFRTVLHQKCRDRTQCYKRDSDSHGSDLLKALHFTRKEKGTTTYFQSNPYTKEAVSHNQKVMKPKG